MSDTNETTNYTAEQFEALQTQLSQAQEAKDALALENEELNSAFLDTLNDDIKDLIPDSLTLKDKIKFSQKLKLKMKDLGKTSNSNPGTEQPGRKPDANQDLTGLSGMDLLRAGLKFKK